MKKIIIFAPSFDVNVGGVVVLHKLCSVLNSLGRETYLYPSFLNVELSRKKFVRQSLRLCKDVFRSLAPYRTNPLFKTPVFSGAIDDNCIVVYPEAVFGNPLEAKHVVRWLLHEPGYHTGQIYYGKGELYFDFNNFSVGFSYAGSKVSDLKLTVIDFPLNIYNKTNAVSAESRKGVAYCVRKGKGKLSQYPLGEGVLIDGKSHTEIADIFKSVKTFVSYDVVTAYSWFAVLCGAESVVIPDDGFSKETWRPNPQDRYGVAYGFDDLEEANKTAHLLKSYIESIEDGAVDSVRDFVRQVDSFFR